MDLKNIFFRLWLIVIKMDLLGSILGSMAKPPQVSYYISIVTISSLFKVKLPNWKLKAKNKYQQYILQKDFTLFKSYFYFLIKSFAKINRISYLNVILKWWMKWWKDYWRIRKEKPLILVLNVRLIMIKEGWWKKDNW